MYTFLLLFYNVNMPDTLILPFFVVCLIWVTVSLAVGIGYSVNYQYYAPNGYWCWIQHRYLPAQYASEYAWMWLTALINIVLYIPLYFRLRGNIVVYGWSARWRWMENSKDAWGGVGSQSTPSAARNMLWFVLFHLSLPLYPLVPNDLRLFSQVSSRLCNHGPPHLRDPLPVVLLAQCLLPSNDVLRRPPRPQRRHQRGALHPHTTCPSSSPPTTLVEQSIVLVTRPRRHDAAARHRSESCVKHVLFADVAEA